MGKLELNKMRKKSALYNTAFELFTTKGLAKTTISDIVENAGVAKGTFYLYFKDKYDIRNKLISHKAGELFSQARVHWSRHMLPASPHSCTFWLTIFWTGWRQKAIFLVSFPRICPGVFLRMPSRSRRTRMIFLFSRSI